jgi:hypothetical protein
VLIGLGETQAEWDGFRAGIVTALAPADELELHLAERFALLTWRARRATAFEAAAAAAVLQPPAAALLAVPTPESDDWVDGLWGDQRINEALTEAAIARRAAAAAPRAVALLAGLADRAGDEPVDAEVARLLWRHLNEAAGLEPEPQELSLLQRFWAAGRRTGSEPDWEYTGWTGKVVRAALVFVAAEGGLSPDRLSALAAEVLAGAVKFWEERAVTAEAAVGRAVGAHQAAAVAAAMKAVGHGSPVLDLALRYEGHVSREMEAVLRQLTALQALRAARSR